MTVNQGTLRVANCSGFFGDRRGAAAEMVDGGPIDVLTGDWLAELTMLILARQRRRRPEAGYAGTFLAELEEVLGRCLERGIKVVSNAGGVNPAGLAEAVRSLAKRLGLEASVAFVDGDDLTTRLPELLATGEKLAHLETGQPWHEAGAEAIAANAYLGHRGIAQALDAGADVVVTGRVTDASLVVGPAAWHFGWATSDWDRLAGAVVAGHAIECGAQVTGGNFSFFEEVPGLERCGFPIAEVHEDGSSVITKHPGTGGMVTTETVLAQLLYEIGSARYLSPDAVARFDSIELTQEGPDRVSLRSVKGEPAPRTLKVGINYLGGFRNSVTFVLPGLDVHAKAAAVEEALWLRVPGGKEAFDEVAVELTGAIDDLDRACGGAAHLRVTVLGSDPDVVGRRFSDAAVQLSLANYPGFHTTAPPQGASEFGVFWPALVDRRLVPQRVEVNGRPLRPPPEDLQESADATATPLPPSHTAPPDPAAAVPASGTDDLVVPLGWLCGARSGDKGGNANVGVWARHEATWPWLEAWLTPTALQALVPDAATCEVSRYDLPNLRACNFVVSGLLGRGVAASTRHDPQAKGLGEEVRACLVPVPRAVLQAAGLLARAESLARSARRPIGR